MGKRQKFRTFSYVKRTIIQRCFKKYFKIGKNYGCEHAYDGGRTRKGRVIKLNVRFEPL
jgi:hypothetical protein